MNRGQFVSGHDPLSTQFAEAIGSALDDPEVNWMTIEFEESQVDPDREIEKILASDLHSLRALLRRMECGGKPVVALITGALSGLRLEVALACHLRVASSKVIEIQFSWLQFGLMPLLGSTQRLPWLTNLETAANLFLFGDSNSFSHLGIYPSFRVGTRNLREEASAWAALNPSPKQPWDQNGSTENQSQLPANREKLERIYLQLRRRVSPSDAAPTTILRCFYEGLERSFDAGVRLEAEQWESLRHTRSTVNRLNTLFFTKRRAKIAPANCEPIECLGVLGAGLMGTGIAYTAARSGLRVMLVDIAEKALNQSREKILKLTQQDPLTRDLEPLQQPAVRINAGSDIERLAECDFVIEAVFEEAETKRNMLRRIADLTDVTLASNTTTFPIADLAKVCRAPERFIGTHFFAPVDRMELLEIIVGENTKAPALKRAIRLASQLGKTPLVVRDGPGFFTSRVVMAYVQEALFLVGEGVSPSLIDNIAQNAGMTIGPLTMADLTGLDLLTKIFESLAAHGRGAARYADETIGILYQFTKRSRFGRKAKAGIYDYTPDRDDWPELKKIFPVRVPVPSFEQIEQRLFAIQTIEALHAKNEGIIQDVAFADLASVLGWSYPAYRGGVISYANEISGFESICAKLRAQVGARFGSPGA